MENSKETQFEMGSPTNNAAVDPQSPAEDEDEVELDQE